MNPRSFGLLRTIALVALAIGLIILALSGYLTTLSSIVLSPFNATQTWVSSRFQALQDYLNTPRDVTVLMQRNAELESQVAALQTQVISLQQQLAEYQILSSLLDFARVYPEYDYIGASVIGRDPSPFLHYVIINRGSDDGLRRGMPVVSQQGLVGRIARVTANSANVQLISDPGSTLDVRLQPARAEAILAGSLTGDLLLDFIPQEAAVQPGDLVLTSGLGGNYPPNILIGQVTSVRSQDFDLFQSGSVQPVVDFSQLEIVLVISNFQPADITPLIPENGTP
ncbi:MAG: rod shape-determining protein MreC [Anaerolineales bacterium]|nr:rod shape-determining protein MreC [Anaerolineales bacterium]